MRATSPRRGRREQASSWLRRREPVLATVVFVLAVVSAVAGVATERVLFTTVGVVPG